MAYKYLICLHCLENNDKKKKSVQYRAIFFPKYFWTMIGGI
jgi:hypothetical protein